MGLLLATCQLPVQSRQIRKRKSARKVYSVSAKRMNEYSNMLGGCAFVVGKKDEEFVHFVEWEPSNNIILGEWRYWLLFNCRSCVPVRSDWQPPRAKSIFASIRCKIQNERITSSGNGWVYAGRGGERERARHVSYDDVFVCWCSSVYAVSDFSSFCTAWLWQPSAVDNLLSEREISTDVNII